jgi:hypothetical protein
MKSQKVMMALSHFMPEAESSLKNHRAQIEMKANTLGDMNRVHRNLK